MDQGTLEWLKWRQQGIGGSDVAPIMGISPHRSALMVYEDKIAELTEASVQKNDFILQKGHRLEVQGRAHLELRTGKTFAPKLITCEQLPYLRVSLDGFSEEDGKRWVAENKLVGADLFRRAKEESYIPDYYRVQILYQMFLANAEGGYYVPLCEVANDGEEQKKYREQKKHDEVHVVEVAQDIEQQKLIIETVDSFWHKHVLARKPPEPSALDWKTLRGKGFTAMARRRKELKMKLQITKDELDTIEAQFKEAAMRDGHPRLVIDDLSILKVNKIGSVDYAKIPELKNVDLNKFRKPSTSYYKFGDSKE